MLSASVASPKCVGTDRLEVQWARCGIGTRGTYQLCKHDVKPTQPVAILIALLFVVSARAEDWPQWLGPMRDGVWTEQGVLSTFAPSGLKIRWRMPVGMGLSSPVVAQGRVFLTDVQLTRPTTQERVLCFDVGTGKPLWTYSYDAEYREEGPGSSAQGPVPTPVCHDGKLYTIGKSDLLCLESASGKLLWKKALDKEYQAQEFLTYASPLVEGQRLIIYAGRFSGDFSDCVIAIDKDSGITSWRAVTDYAAMSSPTIVSAAGKRQLIVLSQQAVTSLDLATGNVYWREATRTQNQSSAVSTPVAQGNMLLVGGLMMKLDSAMPAAAVLWPESKSPARRNLSNTSTPILRGEYVFSARTSGHLVCLEAATGTELWRTDKVTELGSGASIHLTTNGDKAFLYTDRGELILANLSGKGYQEIGRAPLLQPTAPNDGRKFAWPPPAYAQRCIFARSDKELVCASLEE
jgi:outer membrane protein assembly factor BamB